MRSVNKLIEKVIILIHYLRTKFRRLPKKRLEFERWQECKIQTHLQFVRSHSPFYRQLWRDYSNKEWRSFPTIDKTMMMENFDELNTVNIKKDDAFAVAYQAEQNRDFSPMIGSITVGLSSGTSGNRGIFLVSKQERVAWAGRILAKTLPRSILHQEKVAFFLRANSNLYKSVGSDRLEFMFYDLLTPFTEHVKNLNKQQPSILVAPPSMLRLLSKAKKEQLLHIQPDKIISVAEVLDSLDKRIIEKQFERKIDQIYQCTEGFLASTCHYGTLHLNEDIVMIEKEYLDEKRRKFIPIITDFTRKTQPIIRYKLNDILTERKTPCPCGSVFTALEKIEGRADDMFYFQHIQTNELQAVFPDFISRAIIHSSAKITNYIAIQHSVSHVEISLRIQSDSSTDETQRIKEYISEAMTALCHKINCNPPLLQFTELVQGSTEYFGTPNDAQEIRKLRRIERRFDIE